MNVRSSSVVVACALLLSVASPAAAQVQPATNRKKALELYDRGKIQYDLGRWDQAIELWMQAYETFDAPEFLFNIAQAYRHKGDCEQGPFFYRRYLFDEAERAQPLRGGRLHRRPGAQVQGQASRERPRDDRRAADRRPADIRSRRAPAARGGGR